MLSRVEWNWEMSYTELPQALWSEVDLTPVSEPKWAAVNDALATELGLHAGALRENALALLAGNEPPEGSKIIAQAYAGHQFGHFTMLGDGRALLLGEHLDQHGRRWDIQLKGSGPTPYSRRGDGRAALGPMLREYLMSEAMAALGIPTTRSLAVVETGEFIWRQTRQRGAILTRVASSHLRVGTFELAAATGDQSLLRALADYSLRRHAPECLDEDNPYAAFLAMVMERQARLIAQWMSVGFIHGVMNTDNMAISGETLDYGPCAWMNRYRVDTVFSSIDQQGRYAYGNQPSIAQWNLARLAETLIPLLGNGDENRGLETAQKWVHDFPSLYDRAWLEVMRGKLGWQGNEAEDGEKIEELCRWAQREQADWTLTFLAIMKELPPGVENVWKGDAWADWLVKWEQRVQQGGLTLEQARAVMRQHNPRIVPRNHRVEEALSAAEQGDMKRFEQMLSWLSHPYQQQVEAEAALLPPADGDAHYQTFCGT